MPRSYRWRHSVLKDVEKTTRVLVENGGAVEMRRNADEVFKQHRRYKTVAYPVVDVDKQTIAQSFYRLSRDT